MQRIKNVAKALNTIKKLSFFILCLLMSTLVAGQSNQYEKGYIILTNGDTIQGSIKHINAIDLSEYIFLKKEGATEVVKYYPDQLSKFYFEPSSFYESQSVPIRDGNDLIFKQFFLKKLVNGTLELYSLDYQIKENLSPSVEYQTKFYFFREQGTAVLIDLQEFNYRNKLAGALKSKNCQLDKKAKYKFNDRGLSDLMISYNDCIGSPSQKIYYEKPKKKLPFGISGGIALSEIRNDRAFRDFTLEKERTIGYDLNLFINPRLLDWLSIKGGLNYKYRSQTGMNDFVVSEFYTNAGEVIPLASNITINQLSTPWKLLADYNIGNFEPYVFVGGYVGINLKNTAYIDRTTFINTADGPVTISENVDLFSTSFNTFEMGWMSGIGTHYKLENGKNIFLELQYTQGGNESQKDNWYYISQKSWIVLLGFSL